MFSLECTLFFRSKKIIFLGICLLTVFIGNSFLSSSLNQQAKANQISRYEQVIQQFQNILQETELNFQQELLSQEEYEEEVDFFTSYIDYYQKEIKAVEKEDWAYFYQKNITGSLVDGQYKTFAYDSYEFSPKTIENTVLVSKYFAGIPDTFCLSNHPISDSI